MALVRKSLGKKVALGPDLPVEGEWLWGVFQALDDTREMGMGIGPITYTEMRAYAGLFGFRFQAVEIAIIRRLDRAYRVFRTQKQSEKEGAHGAV